MDKGTQGSAQDMKTGAPTPDPRGTTPLSAAGNDTDRSGDGAIVHCTKCGEESLAGTINCPKGCGFLPANPAGRVVGHRGAQFWAEHERLYRDTCEEIAADLGHDSYQDAPAAARAGISGLAQAVIIRDSAYRRVLEDGGPLSAKGRTRRAATVQERYDRRAESWARLLGLKRVPAPAVNIAEEMARLHERGGA